MRKIKCSSLYGEFLIRRGEKIKMSEYRVAIDMVKLYMQREFWGMAAFKLGKAEEVGLKHAANIDECKAVLAEVDSILQEIISHY